MSGSRQRRPNSVDLLPQSTDAVVAEAIDSAIVRHDMTQMDALERLNQELAEHECRPVSTSAWHRLLSRLEDDGIPPRWRLDKKNTITSEAGGDFVNALIQLIDERVEIALKLGGRNA